MAKGATTAEGIEFLEGLVKDRKWQLDKHGVNPWIAELPASDSE